MIVLATVATVGRSTTMLVIANARKQGCLVGVDGAVGGWSDR
jgi:hypothetical protein